MNALQEDLHQTVIGKGPRIRVLRSQQFSSQAEMDQESARLQKSGYQVVAMMAIDGSQARGEPTITRWKDE